MIHKVNRLVSESEIGFVPLVSSISDCTDCKRCRCPHGLDIPGLFAFWKRACDEGRLPDDPRDPEYAAKAQRFLVDYERAFGKAVRAERCTACGQCKMYCPQYIDIPRMIRKVGRLVEKLRRNGRA